MTIRGRVATRHSSPSIVAARYMGDWGLVALLVMSAAALCLRLAIALSELPLLLQKTIPDDAFYYFTIARNAVHGMGMTLDGQNSTDGFHPLWMALLVPIFWLSGGDESLPVHIALFLGAGFSLITGLLLYSTIKAVTRSERASLVGTAVFVFNPGAVMGSVNGLETSLALMMFAATSRLCFVCLRRDSFTSRSAAALGVSAGLTFLARTDYVFVPMAIAGYIACAQNNKPKAGGSYLASVLLVAAPWVLWELISFHSFLQVSGQARPFVLHHEYLAGGSTPWEAALHSLSQLENAVLTVIPNLYFLYQVQHDEFRVGAIGTVSLLALAASVLWLKPSLRHKVLTILSPGASLILIPTMAVAALVLANSGVRWGLQGWYFASVLYLGALYVGILYRLGEEYLYRKGMEKLQLPVIALTLMLLLIANGTRLAEVWRSGYYPWQAEMYDEAMWFRSNGSANWTVGSFNAGVLSYFGGVRTINLDGVVNNGAFGALSNQRLAQYIKDQGITHIADYQFTLEQHTPYMGNEQALRLVPIQEIDDPGVNWQNSFIVIYKVEVG
ncbi:MAG: hypothetical protein EXR50_07900 [Dehalococcoidia bacterium]|nr:hypothetical protein [Dehalococcoidia bacterium]